MQAKDFNPGRQFHHKEPNQLNYIQYHEVIIVYSGNKKCLNKMRKWFWSEER